MKFFDTHAHIGLIVDDPIDQLIITQEANQNGIDKIINICNNLRDFDLLYKNLINSANIYFAIGVSPSEVLYLSEDWEAELVKSLNLERVVALGETGLDYYRKYGDKKSQIELFIRQLELAEQFNKPVIIHNRNASVDIKEILEYNTPSRGAVLHCFSENWDFAESILELNDKVYISLSGNVTYKNSKDLQEVAKNIPLNRLLIESESPFMIPSEFRGKRNRPLYLPSTAKFIANLRAEDPTEVIGGLYENASNLFNV